MASHYFPDPNEADDNGIVCAGAAPHPELLKDAYQHGIFPWPHRGHPLLWFSPDPRFVLPPKEAHLHKSLRKAMKKTSFTITSDTRFRDVMAGCSRAKRRGQAGTWITRDMIAGYCALHDEGLAHSIECLDGDRLVGGLYGVSFGSVFFGESMFALEPDASKIAFATLLANLNARGFSLVDCQAHTEHLARFGAVDWPRQRFLDALHEGLKTPTSTGKWSMPIQPREAESLL